MKIFVAKAIKHIVADQINVATNDSPASVPGKVGTAIEITVRAVTDTLEDMAAWEAAVGKVLRVIPAGDEIEIVDDWFTRCEAIYPNDEKHLTNSGEWERCGFPSLDSPQWHLHDDEHSSATYGWGYNEVRAKKEERASE